MTFDFSEWFGTIDMVFVDGGHDVPTAKADTENALKLIRSHKPAIILWHDYRGPEYPELTDYLDALSEEIPLTHIEDTKLVFLARK
jgi:hypothetical protein